MPICNSLGMSLPLIKYTLALFLIYPFASLLRVMPGKNLKHLFSMLGGMFLVQWIFGPDWIHSFASSAVTYLLCIVSPGKSLPRIAFLWVMGYMTASHIYRMYVAYMTGEFDFTGTQMVLTMKLTSFAYNYYDGTADKKNVFPEKPYDDKKKAKIYSDRQRFAITKLPNPLEYFGYVFCFTCLLCGPAFEYNDYVRSIDGTSFKGSKGQTLSAPSFLPGLSRLLIGIICLAGHLVLSASYSLKMIYNSNFIQSNGYLYRYIYLIVALFAERLKYYFAWKIAEGSSILGGFGFEGFDKSDKPIGWKGVENIDMIGFETAPNIQTLSRVWNKRTQGWLERYTYNRSGRSLLITYFISAFWHGLYPGFFLFFMSVPLLTEIERAIKQKINPIIVPGYDGYNNSTYPNTFIAKIYWVLSCFMVMISMSFIVQTFSMGSWINCHAALGSFHYIPYMVFIAFYILLLAMPSGGKKKSA